MLGGCFLSLKVVIMQEDNLVELALVFRIIATTIYERTREGLFKKITSKKSRIPVVQGATF